MATSRALATTAVLLAAASAALSGCGGGDDSPQSADTEVAQNFACSDVWKANASLQKDYTGCEDDSGKNVPAATTTCTDGSALVTYADRWWAFSGQAIQDAGEGQSLAASADYQSDLKTCQS